MIVYRRRPGDVLAAVELGLRDLGLDHLYTHAYPLIGVISVAPGVTAWCDGRKLTCHHASGEITWPAADAEGAARRLAELAKSAEASPWTAPAQTVSPPSPMYSGSSAAGSAGAACPGCIMPATPAARDGTRPTSKAKIPATCGIRSSAPSRKPQMQIGAAETVVALLPGRKVARETGSYPRDPTTSPYRRLI
jgi:hypothetical protein